mmetsp:Transcript_13408/g.34195  ORF Transcript_13408/g.34195 Transcript_13408/m.34195 type:complete len:199 (+) Transcript_13408:338-934(+)|eukprot:CAMPEP_0177663760 /NCGR_PEP_ID=MMETSP0447-20121125/20098_1 /TAXON_ID=0 /ORGANISM="Stygamoeba regulata, Strain BSH-02190019" /LENGTH=198 /DNA_ID=CAMNT_0019169619 /DNA_START=338 /DNA_END=934 /DNA_ORIENTATION=-
MAEQVSNLDFASIVGGPLTAVINAQEFLSVGTVKFIQEVGFRKDPMSAAMGASAMGGGLGSLMNMTGPIGSPLMVSFSTRKELPDGTVQTNDISVPFITMVPIPILQITKYDMTFTAKISVEQRDDHMRYVGSVSTQRTTKWGQKVKREYSISIRVKAHQQDLPRGMEKALQVLESAIKQTSQEGKNAEEKDKDSQLS